MGAPRVLRDDRHSGTGDSRLSPEFAWRVLLWIGSAFVVAGFADLALAWYPSAFGSSDWEFGTITQTLNGLPVPALGLALVMASAAARGWRGAVRAVAVLFGLWAVVLMALGLLYATSIPIGLRAVVDEVPRLGLKKAIARSVVQFAGYSVVFLVLAIIGWRGTRVNIPEQRSTNG